VILLLHYKPSGVACGAPVGSPSPRDARAAGAALTPGRSEGPARSRGPARTPRRRGSVPGYAREERVGCTQRRGDRSDGRARWRRRWVGDAGAARATRWTTVRRTTGNRSRSSPASWQRMEKPPSQRPRLSAVYRLSVRRSAPRFRAPRLARLGFFEISAFPPRRRGNILGHRNVGLDYTARPANCQSANTFVAARQSRAPRLANPPVCTVPPAPPPPPCIFMRSRTASASLPAAPSPAATA